MLGETPALLPADVGYNDPVQPPVRLIAIDIDGTLLDSKYQVPDANLAALRRAHALGIEVALTTGRRHAFAMPVAKELGFDVCLISSNGAITQSSQGEVFHRHLLPASVARRLLLHMVPFRGRTVLTFDREDRGALVIENVDELDGSIGRWLVQNTQFIEQVTCLADAVPVDPIQAMFGGPVAEMQEAQSLLDQGDFADEITVLKTEYPARDLCILDILGSGCCKGNALERWAGLRGISREEIVAIGDNYNDVSMLDFAGFPFIMGNACEELKRNGWRVAPPNDEGGVAAALVELGI